MYKTENLVKEDIGKRVSSLRKRNGMTQENLAELLDCSVKHISHVERGTALLSLEKCIFLSDYFHCSLDYLLRGKDPENVANALPSHIIEILRSKNNAERDLLLAYLNLYSRIRKTSNNEEKS